MTGPAGSDPRPDDASIPEPLAAYLSLVGRGRYWAAHEALEDAWRARGSGFYHGLILYASAFVHALRRNAHGVRAQLGKAERALEPFAPAHLGIDVDAVLEHARRCREILEEDEAGWKERIPFPEIRADPALVRGDEPELAPPGEPTRPRGSGG